MISRFILSLYRSHKRALLRIFFILFLASGGYLISLSAISFVEGRIQTQAQQIVGGDFVLESREEFDAKLLAELEKLAGDFDIQTARSREFESNVVLQGEELPLLSDIKIISDNYPLRGGFSQASSTGVYISGSFGGGGNQDRIELFDVIYTIAGEIPSENTQSLSFFTGGREVWIPEEIWDSEAMLGLGSRVSYKYFIVSNLQQREQIENILEDLQDTYAGLRLNTIYSQENELSNALLEFKKFLQIFLLSAFFLALISIFFTLETLREQERRNFGLFLLLGYKKTRALALLLGSLLILFHASFLFASGVVYIILDFLGTFSFTKGISLSTSVLLQSYILTGLIVIFGTAISFFKLANARVLELLSISSIFLGKKEKIYFGILAFFALSVFSYIFLKNIFIAFVSSVFALVFLFVFVIFFHLLFQGLFGYIKKRKEKNFSIFYIIRSCVRPGNMSIVIMLPVCIIWSVLYVFTSVSLAFLDLTQPRDIQANYYILNIGQEEKTLLEDAYDAIDVYDILLARIVEINDTPISQYIEQGSRSGEFTREFNLTTHPLPENIYTQGEALKSGTISLDEEFAERLGVGIGESITFLLSGRNVTFKIINTRPAVRENLAPFFYFQLFPDDVASLGRNYFATLDAQNYDRVDIQKTLYDIHPSLQLIDVNQALQQVQEILTTLYKIVIALFFYMSIYIWILLGVSLQVLRDIRFRESHILSILGASKTWREKLLFGEYSLLLGIACILSQVIGFFISVWLLNASSVLTLTYSIALTTSFAIFLGFAILLFVFLPLLHKK